MKVQEGILFLLDIESVRAIVEDPETRNTRVLRIQGGDELEEKHEFAEWVNRFCILRLGDALGSTLGHLTVVEEVNRDSYHDHAAMRKC